MTFRVRFLNPETNVLIGDVFVKSASVNTGLGKTGEWSTEVPTALDILPYLEEGQTAQLYYQGKLVIEGEIKSFNTKLEDENTIEIKGRDFLDALYDFPANTLAVFKDVLLVQALNQLLLPVGWRLGDIATMINPLTTKITGDFRSEENLLPQIQKLLNSVPKLTYRYGGVQAGYPTLDIGFFATPSGIRFYSPPNEDIVINAGDGLLDVDDTTGYIKELSYQTTLEDLVWGIEAYGGEVTDETGTKRNISLFDAFRDNPARLDDPQYPIVEVQYGKTGRYITWDKTRQPGPGGQQIYYTGLNASNFNGIGNFSGVTAGLNSKAAVFFKSPGGYLQDFIFQFGSGSSGSLPDLLKWWLYTGDVYPTAETTPLIDSGFIAAWSSLSWERAYFSDLVKSLYLPVGQEYTLVLAYDKPGGYPISTFRSLEYNVTANAQSMFRCSTYDDATGVWTARPTINPNMELTFLPSVPDAPGAMVVKTMSQFAPENTEANATLADCKAAGVALWEWCKRYIADHIDNQIKYNMTPLGEVIFPMIGDTIEVHGVAQGTIIDPYTERVETVTTKVDKDNLRVDTLSLDFSDDKVEMKFDLTDGNGITNLDFFVTIYDSAKNQEPIKGVLRSWMLSWQTVTASQAQGNADPDTTLSDGRPAKLVTLALPISPGGTASKVYLEFTPLATDLVNGGYADVEMVTYPAADGTTQAVVKVCTGLAWEYSSSVTFDIYYAWY